MSLKDPMVKKEGESLYSLLLRCPPPDCGKTKSFLYQFLSDIIYLSDLVELVHATAARTLDQTPILNEEPALVEWNRRL